MTDFRAFDVHHHWGVSPLESGDSQGSIDERVQRHVDVMDKSGIDSALLMAPPKYANPKGLEDTADLNNEIATLRDDYSEHFPVGVGTVEPSYGKAGLDEIDRMFEDLDLDGIMWHNLWQKSTPDAPIMLDFIERASEHDAVVILHAIAGSEAHSAWRVFKVLEEFPDTQFVVLDIFSSSPQADYARHRAPDVDNAVFGTAAGAFITRKVQDFVRDVSADKLVLGTDYYTGFPVARAPEIGEINETNLSDEEKQAILWDNAAEVFGLE